MEVTYKDIFYVILFTALSASSIYFYVASTKLEEQVETLLADEEYRVRRAEQIEVKAKKDSVAMVEILKEVYGIRELAALHFKAGQPTGK